MDCSWRISHAEHRNSRKGWFGAQSDEADRNTGAARKAVSVRSGEQAPLEGELPAFGRLKGAYL